MRPVSSFEVFTYELTKVPMHKSTEAVVSQFVNQNDVLYCPPLKSIKKKTGMSFRAIKRAITLGINDGSLLRHSFPNQWGVIFFKLKGLNRYHLICSENNFAEKMRVIEYHANTEIEYVAVLVMPEFEKLIAGYNSGNTFVTDIYEKFKKEFVSNQSKKETQDQSATFTFNAEQASFAVGYLYQLYLNHITQYKQIDTLNSKIKMGKAEYKNVSISDARKYAELYSIIYW